MKAKVPIRPGLEGYAVIVDQMRQLTMHHHDELEVNLVLSGKASYLFGHRRVPLFAGSLIWIFPEQEHVLIDWSHDFSMWVLLFKPAIIDRYAGKGDRRILRSPDPGDIFCRQIDPQLVDVLSQVYDGAPDDNRDPEFVNATLGYALVASWRIYQSSRESVLRTDVHPAVAKAARLISNAEEPIPLNRLAREAGLSASRLSRLFKRQTGVSLTTFRHRTCLKRFLGLYRTGARYSLIEAALLAGFGSYAQFHRIFTRFMGSSPMTYRRNVQLAPTPLPADKK
jgi:AraC-like DNA-binding protein